MALPAFTDATTGKLVYINPLTVTAVTTYQPSGQSTGVTWITFEKGNHQTVAEPADQVSVKLWAALKATA